MATDRLFTTSGKINPESKYQSVLDQNIPSKISLKVGAQVMLKFNLDVIRGFVNGSRGVVTGFEGTDGAYVKFLNGVTLLIRRHLWDIKINQKTKAHRTQIPLILAWALTIHKSQGSTLDSVICDLGSSIFAEGQSYVALSRVRGLKGLYLRDFDPTLIRKNKTADNFMRELEAAKYYDNGEIIPYFEKYRISYNKPDQELKICDR